MPEPLLPALDPALLKLVEGKKERAPRCADNAHKSIDVAPRDMILRKLREAHSAHADIQGLPAQIGKAIVVACRGPKQRRHKSLGRNRKMRKLLKLGPDGDDKRPQLEIPDIAFISQDIAPKRRHQIRLGSLKNGSRKPR